MFAFFRNLNAARRAASTSNPAYLSTLVKPYQLDNHTLALSKPPLLSVLNNYGAAHPAMGIYVEPLQTSFKPLTPVVDVISGQIFSTDPRGGLTVTILGGEPRVFLPLSVYRDPTNTAVGTWKSAEKLHMDTNVGQKTKLPSSPTSPRRRTHRSMLSMFGRGKSDL